jgi:hypothetical protein
VSVKKISSMLITIKTKGANKMKLPMRAIPKIICAAVIVLCAATSSRAEAQQATKYFTHVAKSGDTLIGLADRYLIEKKNWQAIQNQNKIPNPRRIKPGTEIRIPIDLMRSEPATAKVIAVQGPVEGAVGNVTGPLEKGAVLTEGAGIKTGENGFVTLQLADGSTIVVQSKSQVKLEVARVLANTDGVPSTTVGLTSGRVESSVEKRKNQGARFEISTPTSSMGVRGTRFRVSADESGKISRGEVLEGVVAVGSAAPSFSSAAKPLDLGAGFGSVVEEGKAASAPIALLAAPDLSAAAALQERLVLRFKFADVAGATGYRGQVATDSAFNNLLADEVFKTPEAKFANLDDGQYFFRARAIDKVALEGSDAVHAFKLKARPEPPFTSEPKNKNKLAVEKVDFKWASSTEAGSYRFQLASNADFSKTISDERAVKGSAFSPADSIKPGDYFWRVASVRPDGDVGPFGDTQSFTLKALPQAPNPPKEEGNRVGFSWSGEAGQTFDFQLASDAGFKTIVDEKKLAQPEITIEKPSDAGTYYMRYRSIDADGFVGPYSSAQTIEVKANRWWLLLFLVPFLL